MYIKEARIRIVCHKCARSNWIFVEPTPMCNTITKELECVYCNSKVDVTVYIEDKNG
jgi:hypothetical protein